MLAREEEKSQLTAADCHCSPTTVLVNKFSPLLTSVSVEMKVDEDWLNPLWTQVSLPSQREWKTSALRGSASAQEIEVEVSDRGLAAKQEGDNLLCILKEASAQVGSHRL